MSRFITPFVIISTVLVTINAYPQDIQKAFPTKYATVMYSEDKDMEEFLWRVGGQRFEFIHNTSLASNRIDRIVERVEEILDMRPYGFHVTVNLSRSLQGPHTIAYYTDAEKALYVSVESVTDGVFAHEIAHAVIAQYFSVPPQSKIQEILTQYVDKFLWSDY